MTFAEQHNLRPGDVVVCPKSDFNIVGHYLVYGGKNYYREDFWYENIRVHGVRTIINSQFVRENPSYSRVRRFEGNEYQRALAIQRAESQLGRPYSLAGFNCEDYANYVQYGRVYSSQTNTAGALGIMALALFAGWAFSD